MPNASIIYRTKTVHIQGINESKCDIIDIYFAAKELDKVVFRNQVTGTIWPIRQKGSEEMRLQGLSGWRNADRRRS